MSRRLYFFLFQMKFYILFSISFLIFWNSTNLVYLSQVGNKDLVSEYIFTSQRESHSVPDMVFFANLQLLFPIWSYRESIYRKLTSSILMEIANIPVVLVDKLYFCMRHPIKAWLFEKIIFQLVYLFYIVLKPLMFY